MSIPIKFKTGHNFTEEDDLGIGEPVWDNSHAIRHRFGVGSGGVNPKYYPGIDDAGNMFMQYSALIKSADPAHPDSGIGYDANGDFIVKIDGVVTFRSSKLGATFNGAIVQQNANPQYLPSREGLAGMLFPLYNEKLWIFQFNRPAFAAVSILNKFFAYQDLAGLLGDFSSTFTRGGSADGGSVRFVNGALNYDYAIANQPRIAYSMNTTKCRGLLIEPAATNLLVQSFTLTSWPTNTGLTLTQENNATWIGRGLNRPYSFVETAGSSEKSITQTITAAPGKPLTVSFFYQAKAFTGTRRFTVFVANSDRSYLFGANFDATSGSGPVFSANRTVGNGAVSNVTVESIRNGIYRISVTGTINSADNTASLILNTTFASLGDTAGNTTLTYTPGTNVGNWCLIGDFQVEQNPFVTTYIQTATSPLTRNADVLALSLSALKFSPVEGTFEFNFKTSNIASVGTVLFSLTNPDGSSHLDVVITSVDTTANTYTIGTNLYQASLATVSNVNIAVVPIAKSRLTYTYANLPAVLNFLLIDGSKGFFGAVSLLSYE